VRKHSDEAMLEALREHRTIEEAAKALGIHKRSLYVHKARLARTGHSPEHDMTHTVPDGFLVKGVSTYYNKDGVASGQWVKSAIDHERQAELIRQWCQAMTAGLPQLKPRAATGHHLKHLAAVYPIGDAHIGVRSWKAETGQDWDLQIAERVQCQAMAALVETAPATEQAVIVNLGDWFHSDNMEGTTSRSGHILDVDGRYAKMIQVGIKVMRQCIESALAKHARVKVYNVIGNHDDTGALWLGVALGHIYANEPRVEVESSPAPFMYFEHGKTLLGFHHGHSCKPDRLPGVMAADQPEAWGRTRYRAWYIGHVHHQSVKEYSGCFVESFNTLTAKDAYAAWGGYRAAQNMKCIILHDKHGEVARHTVSPAMLEDEEFAA
ncbi:oxidoreductase, partial [uncultured Pseudomonas sp.]|uniref:oxidoreductase n=1 Tax=uncultured Pseudomonas sp. TaxID=114707 RepID=UPI0025CF97BB